MDASAAQVKPDRDLAYRKARVAEIRDRAKSQFRAGTPGIQIAGTTCEAMDRFLLELIEDSCAPPGAAATAEQAAVIAVGGTGRGELVPYSDIDLLFLDRGPRNTDFRRGATRVVQSCWDAKLELGHSIRTVGECISLARQDCEVATTLIEARLLWGSQALYDRLRRQFRRKVVEARRRAFIEDCLAARAKEFPEPGAPAQELEPNVKRSLGGLRDLHLIRWLGFALFDSSDLDTLRLKGALSRDEAYIVRGAWEMLTRVRIDLHLAACKDQDLLTRDDQLRIAESRDIAGTAGQRPVERFMQEYFRHSSGLAKVSRRFAARHRPRSMVTKLSSALLAHRAEGVLRVTPEEIDAPARHRPRICRDLESVLRLYRAAALYGVLPSPSLVDAIETAAAKFSGDLSPEAAELFLDILRSRAPLGGVLRSMYDTGVLERVIPHMRHARCLMQFNQYHHYTVDEHSLRAVEAASRLRGSDGAIGAAYEALKHKELLHLALLLHDLGKGFDEDHWEVGRRIALDVAERLRLGEHHRDQLEYLVHQHLEMAHNAMRRDISDPQLLLQFAHQAGTPETLAMLYVLTFADISAVGPGTWTSWKEELLTELYNRCQLILSGTRDHYHVEERLRRIRAEVLDALVVNDAGYREEERRLWVDARLDEFSAYYFSCTSPPRIAADLEIIATLGPDDVAAQGCYELETDTVEFRVITRNAQAGEGCFHKLAGVLTAKRLEILSADINTTRGGVIVDSFRVLDCDFDGATPEDRIAEIADTLRRTLLAQTPVEPLFHRHKRFGAEQQSLPVSNLPIRVELDNESSESRTVIDVFAHDRPGLLYSVARTLYELKLSVDLAKISTHYDQVVDVFYVREADGRKINQPERLQDIRNTLTRELQEFERAGYRRFIA